MFKAVLSNNIEMSVTDENQVVFNATILLAGLSRKELDEVLDSVDLKEGTLKVSVTKE